MDLLERIFKRERYEIEKNVNTIIVVETLKGELAQEMCGQLVATLTKEKEQALASFHNALNEQKTESAKIYLVNAVAIEGIINNCSQDLLQIKGSKDILDKICVETFSTNGFRVKDKLHFEYCMDKLQLKECCSEIQEAYGLLENIEDSNIQSYIR